MESKTEEKPSNSLDANDDKSPKSTQSCLDDKFKWLAGTKLET